MCRHVTDDDRALIQRFDTLFVVARDVVDDDSRPLTAIVRGTQSAYAAIIRVHDPIRER